MPADMRSAAAPPHHVDAFVECERPRRPLETPDPGRRHATCTTRSRMRYCAVSCDYDGTLASAGRVRKETVAALERVRASGRRLLLVTGRQLPDLGCPACAARGAALGRRRDRRDVGGVPAGRSRRDPRARARAAGHLQQRWTTWWRSAKDPARTLRSVALARGVPAPDCGSGDLGPGTRSSPRKRARSSGNRARRRTGGPACGRRSPAVTRRRHEQAPRTAAIVAVRRDRREEQRCTTPGV